MKRRDFLKSTSMAGAGLFFGPWLNTVKAAAEKLGYNPAEDCAVTAAHVEKGSVDTLQDIYFDHALLCEQVHNWAADQALGKEVPVNLLRINPHRLSNPLQEQLKKLDVFSVSTVEEQSLPGESAFDNEIPAQKRFWEESDAIGVYAAGNDALSTTESSYAKKSPADFADATALVVGEAAENQGQVYIKAISENSGHVSLICRNPMDAGEKFAGFNPVPDLTGSEMLISGWLREQEAGQLAAEKYAPEAHPELYHMAKVQHAQRLAADTAKEAEYARQARYYVQHPEELHRRVLPEFRQSLKVTEDNMVGGLAGSSFSAPVVAGYLSAAKHVGKLNACAGGPELNSQELVALALLSTDPVHKAEIVESITDPLLGLELKRTKIERLPQEVNARGLPSSFRAGFGVFNPEKFQESLKAAYDLLKAEPGLQKKRQTVVSNSHYGTREDIAVFELNVPEGTAGETTVMNVQLEYDAWFKPPPWITLISPEGTEYNINMAWGGNVSESAQGYHPENRSWGTTDRFLGEKASGTWKVKFPREDGDLNILDPKNMKLTLHGMPQGALLDKLIDRKLEQDKSPTRTGSGGRGR